jgi:hypothetical protein
MFEGRKFWGSIGLWTGRKPSQFGAGDKIKSPAQAKPLNLKPLPNQFPVLEFPANL